MVKIPLFNRGLDFEKVPPAVAANEVAGKASIRSMYSGMKKNVNYPVLLKLDPRSPRRATLLTKECSAMRDENFKQV